MADTATSRIIDLSHHVTNELRTYPGIPAPRISAFLTHEGSRERYQGQCELTFSEVHLVAGVGTYLDSPYHRQAGLPDHAALALDRLVDLPGVVADLRGRMARSIDAADLPDPPRGSALILLTGMDAHWETDRYWQEGPFLTERAAAKIVASGIAVLAADFLNVDDTSDPRRPAHTALLRAGIPIVENLRNAASLPRTGFRFHAPTVPLEGVASFPIRAYALVRP